VVDEISPFTKVNFSIIRADLGRFTIVDGTIEGALWVGRNIEWPRRRRAIAAAGITLEPNTTGVQLVYLNYFIDAHGQSSSVRAHFHCHLGIIPPDRSQRLIFVINIPVDLALIFLTENHPLSITGEGRLPHLITVEIILKFSSQVLEGVHSIHDISDSQD
jgi:hypothetical protein